MAFRSRHAVRACPRCGYPLNVATPVDGEDAAPEAGDVSVCCKCAATLVFIQQRGQLDLRLPTQAEADQLRKDRTITRLKAALLTAARKVRWELE
jgi:hypothetical protein